MPEKTQWRNTDGDVALNEVPTPAHGDVMDFDGSGILNVLLVKTALYSKDWTCQRSQTFTK